MKKQDGFIQVLKNRNFSLFWSGQIVSQFGDQLNQMALVALIYMIGASGVEFSKLMILGIVPTLFFGPVSGVFVDRWKRKKVMVNSDILRGVLVLSIPFLKRSILSVYAVMFLVFIINKFFLSARSASIPNIVNREHLLVANSLSTSAYTLTIVLGSGIGGIIVSLTGWKTGFYIDSITYFISALLLSLVTVREPSKVDTPTAKDDMSIKSSISHFKNDIKVGFKEITQNESVLFAVLALSMIMSVAGVSFVLFPVLVRNTFRLGTGSLGILISILGGGLLLGSSAVGKFGHKLAREKLILLSFLFTGIIILMLSRSSAFLYFLSGTFLLGISVAPIFIVTETILQENVIDAVRGKVFGTKVAIVNAAFLFFGIISGAIIDFTGEKSVFVVLGVICILFAIAGEILLYRKTQENLKAIEKSG